MSDEKGYEVQEFVDDALAAGQMNDHMLNRYVYEFQQGSRVIRDLTAAAIAHIGLENNISVTEYKMETMEQGVLCYATAEKLDTGQKAHGAAYAPFEIGNRPDLYCHQKALTKASRNARRQLIPAIVQVRAVDELLKLKAAPAEAGIDAARKRVFAKYNEIKDDLDVPGDLFWEGIKEYFSVESRNDMKKAQWMELYSDLSKSGFGPIVKRIRKAYADTQPKGSDDDIGF